MLPVCADTGVCPILLLLRGPSHPGFRPMLPVCSDTGVCPILLLLRGPSYPGFRPMLRILLHPGLKRFDPSGINRVVAGFFIFGCLMIQPSGG
jgi:hypothetical protein